MENPSWLIGNGREVNLWLDNWCGTPLATKFNIPNKYNKHLYLRREWSMLYNILLDFPTIKDIINTYIIPLEKRQDMRTQIRMII